MGLRMLACSLTLPHGTCHPVFLLWPLFSFQGSPVVWIGVLFIEVFPAPGMALDTHSVFENN